MTKTTTNMAMITILISLPTAPSEGGGRGRRRRGRRGEEKEKAGQECQKEKGGVRKICQKNLNKRWGATMLFILEVTQYIADKIF